MSNGELRAHFQANGHSGHGHDKQLQRTQSELVSGRRAGTKWERSQYV